ncbi:hypothetical protein [Thalassospira australica]|nr:hypothetical protein [Thalassospira australica]
MALNIISNYAANVAHRNLSNSDEMATRSLSKLLHVTMPPPWPSAPA